MHKHPLRKFLGLTVLYIIVIVGIFVVQFKTESVISRSFGELSYSVSQTQTENNETKLKNRFSVSFKGLVFNIDEKNPVMAADKDGNQTELQLNGYSDNSANSVRFTFDGGSSIEFRGETREDGFVDFSISTQLSADYKSIYIPYKITHLYTSEETSSKSSFLLTSKNGEFIFTAPGFDSTRMMFTGSESLAKFSTYVASQEFEFSQTEGYEGASEAAVAKLYEKLRGTMVSKVQALLSTAKIDSLSETDITAYVAELSSQGKYNQAIDSVPDSFKKGNKRSYISSPFFNNLAVMYRSLSIQDEKYKSLVESKTLDVFNVDGIADYILREKKTQKIKDLLAVPSQGEFSATAYQAGGIISIYLKLYKKDKTIAAYLEPVLDSCIEKIRASCRLDNGALSFQEEDESVLSVEQAVLVGNALAQYGQHKNEDSYIKAGNLAVYTALNQQEPDIRILSEIYPMMAPDNHFLPHTEILGYYGNTCVWVWTCAKSVIYTHKPADTANIFIDFPLNLTHYMMFNGVPNFGGRIEIQGQMFRTDPRFETYNSSGYVYLQNSRSLLIKSRHKSKMELIRLFYDGPRTYETCANPASIPELPKPAPKVEPKPEPKPEAPAAAEPEATPAAEPENVPAIPAE
ncbi:hypothetical protein [Treponema sp.]|uniref:hypothetical protein n=1 Tax=Treponema sp. TaxID=166 RepID=UPI00298E3C8A|nr:hypothetical protein [Treponema sp.]MCQ2240945.1 hypothetical protein [Treponema sp.]